MTTEELEHYLHTHIPLTAAMGIEVVSSSSQLVALRAPLAPNINVHHTAFGGSLATLGITASWSVLYLRLEEEAVAAQLVIHRSETEFLLPVSDTFEAHARIDANAWQSFATMFKRRGKARVSVTADIVVHDRVAARITGEFVALAEHRA
jgi:thioesterase domain-containing protein